jgi:polyisoprenoid-binding protein YceI
MCKTLNLQRSLRYLLACALIVAFATPVYGQQPVPDAVLQSGTLSFLGHATVGDFVGSTTAVRGAIIGGRDYATTHGWVEAPVRALLTGNDRRDRDMRSSMNADRYAAIRFDLTGATVISSTHGALDSLALVLHGALTIHGMKRSVDLPATGLRSADAMHLTCRFPLDLADYDIGGLTKMLGLLRMERLIEVRVDLQFVDVATVWANP